jgi:hypothetical protein
LSSNQKYIAIRISKNQEEKERGAVKNEQIALATSNVWQRVGQ